jgi:hypothetical protein
MGQGGFSQARGTVEQEMIEDVLSSPGGSNGYLEVLFDLVLADIFIQRARPETYLTFYVLFVQIRRDPPRFHNPPE